MSEREHRVGMNEAMFREVNERLRELDQSFANSSDGLDLICECADTGCTERVEMHPDAYEQLRAGGRRFVVVAGHELAPDVERVVERHGPYVVVEKRGDAGAAAELTDPRTNGE